MRRRTQYDNDSDRRISNIEYALLPLEKKRDASYSYDDLVAAILSPGMPFTGEAAREDWVADIQAALKDACLAEGVTAGEVLVGLGKILSTAGGYIVRDERNAQSEKESS